jgi:hypothetical protein
MVYPPPDSGALSLSFAASCLALMSASSATRPPSASFWRRAAAWLVMVCLWSMAGLALAQTPNKFDHLKTGFPLTGTHTTVRCESCHNNGVFKGTPKDCRSCHSPGNRPSQNTVVMPGNHIPTTLACETCHATQSFSATRFSHATGISPGQACATCHDGIRAQGKGPGHVVTKASCDSCHTTTSRWDGARPDHNTFTASTNCASCHNGSGASGKAANHIPTSQNCFSCHSVSTWKPSKWNHTQGNVKGACSSCHTGGYPPADGRSSDHIPYNALVGVNVNNCDSCHTSGYSNWANGKFHSNVTVNNQCATCHTGAFNGPDGKSGNHIPYTSVSAAAGAGCETCHKGSFTSWATGKFHSNVNSSTQCASCHLTSAFGLTARPNNADHTGVTSGCEDCHQTPGSWAVTANKTKPDHSRFTSSTPCATCHTGSIGKTANHIPTSLNCYSCHGVTTWTPTKWNHTQSTVKGACSTCHTGAYQGPDGKVANHIPYASVSVSASANCDSCHKGGYASWNPGQFHANFTVSSSCSTCHSGAYLGPDGKPGNHIPYASVTASMSAGCETCHKGSFTSWATGAFHSSVSTATQCASCHLTSAYGLTAPAPAGPSPPDPANPITPLSRRPRHAPPATPAASARRPTTSRLR